jgi:hypothetical protein
MSPWSLPSTTTLAVEAVAVAPAPTTSGMSSSSVEVGTPVAGDASGSAGWANVGELPSMTRTTTRASALPPPVCCDMRRR